MTEIRNRKYKWKTNLIQASIADDIQEAEKEWEIVAQIEGREKKNCICGSRIHYKFFMINHKNDNHALVGGGCKSKILKAQRTKNNKNIKVINFERVKYDELNIEEYLKECKEYYEEMKREEEEKIKKEQEEKQRMLKEQEEYERKLIELRRKKWEEYNKTLIKRREEYNKKLIEQRKKEQEREKYEREIIKQREEIRVKEEFKKKLIEQKEKQLIDVEKQKKRQLEEKEERKRLSKYYPNLFD